MNSAFMNSAMTNTALKMGEEHLGVVAESVWKRKGRVFFYGWKEEEEEEEKG